MCKTSFCYRKILFFLSLFFLLPEPDSKGVYTGVRHLSVTGKSSFFLSLFLLLPEPDSKGVYTGVRHLSVTGKSSFFSLSFFFFQNQIQREFIQV